MNKTRESFGLAFLLQIVLARVRIPGKMLSEPGWGGMDGLSRVYVAPGNFSVC